MMTPPAAFTHQHAAFFSTRRGPASSAICGMSRQKDELLSNCLARSFVIPNEGRTPFVKWWDSFPFVL